jgi:hypothetical protein
MSARLDVVTHGFILDEVEARRINHQLAALGDRLAVRPDARVLLRLREYPAQRRFTADLRVQLGPLGAHLVSRQDGSLPGQAARRAVDDVERQLERKVAGQRGDPSFGVPSRRRPPPPPGA